MGSGQMRCRGEFRDQRVGDFFLLRAVGEDHRTVLAADVVALAVQGGRVVDGEKGRQQRAVVDHGGIEADLDYLGMAGSAGAYAAVIRLVGAPPA
jgi:hypothetical protein